MKQTQLSIALMAIYTSLSCASDIDFTGVSGGNFGTSSNWQNGNFPTTSDIAFLDATASLDTPAPNAIQGIRIGTQGVGTMHITFDAALNASTNSNISSRIGSGSGNSGALEQTNGSVLLNELEIGGGSSTGVYNLNRGSLTIARRLQGNSLYLGTDANKTSGGFGTLSITAGSLSTRGGVYLGSANGAGIGVFEVQGSDSAQIGIGSTNNIDGSWTQNTGSILKVKIDRSAQGVTPILIDDAENDNSGGDVLFENGALLDVRFLEGFLNGGTFTVMEWEGNITDNGLKFAPSVDTNIWSFNINTASKTLTVTAKGAPYQRQFVHPGSAHKISDLERMRDMVNAGVEPWASSFDDFAQSGRAQFTYNVQSTNNPLTVINGNTPNNFRNDCLAAYYNALMWFITEDSRHADKAVEIFNAWSGLTSVNIIPLELGRSSLHLIEAAEIIKHTYSGWDATDIQKFSDMLVYPGYSNTTIPTGPTTFYWGMYNGDPRRAGNQGYFAMRSLLAMGIFLDNERIYDRVIRLARGATNRADDLAYPTGPPINGNPTATHDFAIQWGQQSRQTTIADYGYNEVFANYIFENGQNEESSRDQVHAAVGLVNISALCEVAWNQGDNLYGVLDNRPLLGWEYTLRYNLSLDNTYPDQPKPWEPTLETGEYFQRRVRTGRRLALRINPHIDGNLGAFTRGEANGEPIYELNLGHYRDRMNIDSDEITWLERGHALLEASQGFEDEGSNVFSMPSWGGMKYRRVSPGDPVQGFSNNTPIFGMHTLPATIEAENYDHFTLVGEGRTYHDLSAMNSGLAYRPTDGVDLINASEGGFAVSSIEAGEWVTYTVSVPVAGEYDLFIRYASTASGGSIQIAADGVDLTGQVSVPNGGSASSGANDWRNLILATDVPLKQGVQQLRVNFGGNSNAFLLNSLSIGEAPEGTDSNLTDSNFIPDPNKKYYIDSPASNLRIAATGNDQNPFTTSTSTTGPQVEWVFVNRGNGSWHIQLAAGGSVPRLRTRGSGQADMQATSSSGTLTYFDFAPGALPGSYFATLPDFNSSINRMQVLPNGEIHFVPQSFRGVHVSFSFTEVPTNENLLAHWPMDEGSGKNISDISGNGFNATMTNASHINGFIGGALNFNGSSSTATIPSSTFAEIDDEITIAMWVFGGAGQARNDTTFFALNSTGERILNIHLPWGDSRVYWDAGFDGSFDRISRPATTASFRGGWNHWAFSKNSNSGVMNIYLNGTLFHTGSGNTKPMSGISSATFGSANGNRFYQGAIDELMIFNSSLSATEVADLFNSFSQTLSITSALSFTSALSDYENWTSTLNSSEIGLASADFDGDGLSNDAERIWGLDPTESSSNNPYPSPFDPETGTFQYTRRNVNLSGLSYSIWTSPDLENWTEDQNATQQSLSNQDAEVETIQVTLSEAQEQGDLFFRVKATSTSPQTAIK